MQRGEKHNKAGRQSGAASVPAPPGDFKKYAVFIAINDYRQWRDVVDLRGCLNDAEAVRDVLETQHDFVTLGALYDSSATQENIFDLFERIAAGEGVDGGVQVRAQDQLLVYVAGHGERDGKGLLCFDRGKHIPFVDPPDRLWAPSNDDDDKRTVPCQHCNRKFLRDSELRRHVINSHASFPFFARNVSSQHQLLVIDACHAGALVKHHAETRLKPKLDFEIQPVFHAALSVTEDECALEMLDPDNNVRGVFSWHFVRAIDTKEEHSKGNVAFRDGYDSCTASAVIYKIREKVFEEADAQQADQNVCFGGYLEQPSQKNGGQFMFYRPAVGRALQRNARKAVAGGKGRGTSTQERERQGKV